MTIKLASNNTAERPSFEINCGGDKATVRQDGTYVRVGLPDVSDSSTALFDPSVAREIALALLLAGARHRVEASADGTLAFVDKDGTRVSGVLEHGYSTSTEDAERAARLLLRTLPESTAAAIAVSPVDHEAELIEKIKDLNAANQRRVAEFARTL